MWFAAMGSPNEYPWTLHLIWKLLHNDPGAVSLFRANPFPQNPPRYVRAVWYRYEFVRPNLAGTLVEAREARALAAAALGRHAGAAEASARRRTGRDFALPFSLLRLKHEHAHPHFSAAAGISATRSSARLRPRRRLAESQWRLGISLRRRRAWAKDERWFEPTAERWPDQIIVPFCWESLAAWGEADAAGNDNYFRHARLSKPARSHARKLSERGPL